MRTTDNWADNAANMRHNLPTNHDLAFWILDGGGFLIAPSPVQDVLDPHRDQ
jgi:hypothetical protein